MSREIEKLDLKTTDDYINFVMKNSDMMTHVNVEEIASPDTSTKIKVTFTFLKRVMND